MTFKPLLAETCEDIARLKFPVLASPKLDGIRCVKLQGQALTRKLKPIPNDYVRAWVEANLPDGIDGELMLRDHRAPFNEVSSAIMSKAGEPDFVFCAFDLLQEDPRGGWDITDSAETAFEIRYAALKEWIGPGTPQLRLVEHDLCLSVGDLSRMVDMRLQQGFEGVMVRDPAGRYKFGRSTLKERILLKIKSFVDEEATVVGVVEQMHNTNEATRDAVGNVKRSSAKAGKVGKGVLGALVCVTEDGAEFEIGTGFTDAVRTALWSHWQNGNEFCGRQVKFKHQPPPGGRKPGEKPRFPVFLGWRQD